MPDVKIKNLSNGKIAFYSPFHPDLARAARDLGGKPARDQYGKFHYWEFDPRDLDRVRDLGRRFFGTDGTEDASDLVTVRVHVNNLEGTEAEGRFAGRLIAERPARDASVRLAPGVVLVAGRFPSSGGSMKYPDLNADDDTVIEIRDLPRAALAIAREGSYEIVEETIDVTALAVERERLTARLTEIDALLARANAPAAS